MIKQGRIPKQFKDFEKLFEAVDLNESTVYFKINLYKFTSNYPVLGRPILLSHYFKNNLTLTKSVYKENTDLLQM